MKKRKMLTVDCCRCFVWGIAWLILLGMMSSLSHGSSQVGLYDVFETQVSNLKSYSNPFDFNVIELQATFTSPSGRRINFFGFYDGDGRGGQSGNVWTLRFMPDELGIWSYIYSWSDGTPGSSGGFEVVDTGLLGPLKVATDNSWYFRDSRGRPFHWRPYGMHLTALYSPTNSLLADIGWFKNLIQTRIIDKGYNFTMWDGPADRKNVDQPYAWKESWWLNPSETKRFNLPVWHAWEDALRLAADNGVYVITFAGMIWQGAQYSFTDFKVFLRYWLARFAPFYNFLGWSPTWEWYEVLDESYVNQIMQYVYDNDPWKRPLTIHDTMYTSFQSWGKFSMRQVHSNTVFSGNSRSARTPFNNLPIIGSEDIWESTFSTMPRNATEVRRAAWGIQMAGVMPLYSDWTPDPPPTGGNGVGEPEVRRMFDFFYSKTRYRQYQQLNTLVSSSARQVASGIPGEEYLVYDEDGGSITINLSGAPATKSFSVLWYDPKIGAQQTGANINGGASRTLTSPFSGDSVLLLGGTTTSPDTTPPAPPTALRVVQ